MLESEQEITILFFLFLETTIHEDSAAYALPASSLTMEVEVVIHALRWLASRGDSLTTHAIVLTDSTSLSYAYGIRV